MAEEKMTIVDLRKAIAKQTDTEEAAVANFLAALFPTIVEGLKKDKQVRINGLGTFKLQWVEPRKSVNISTGEPIVIEGYQKLGFTPEQSVKERINEPYANLEPVELDAEGNPLPEQPRHTIDPLEKMDEQAEEIKDILADLGASTAAKAEAKAVETEAEEKQPEETEVEEPQQEEPKAEEPASEEPEAEEPEAEAAPATQAEETANEEPEAEEASATQAEEPKADEPANDEAEIEESKQEETKTEETPAKKAEEPKAEATRKEEKKERPYRPWLVALITILIFCIALVCGYFFLQRWVEKLADKLNGKIETAEQAEMLAMDSAAFVTDTVAADSIQNDTIPAVATEAPKDFYEQRDYSDTLAIEKVVEGSRLAQIARKYYNNKDCWVFIYDANRDKMKTPGSVSAGMRLIIPKLPDYITDPTNEKSVTYIKQLQNEFEGK